MFLVFLFTIGLAIGSFLNVLIDRLPKSITILGRSQCDHCGHVLSPADLIPVVSYILLQGRCRYCHKKISSVYSVVELLTGVLFVITWQYLPRFEYEYLLDSTQQLLFRASYLGIVSSLVVTFFSDLKYRIIPDETTLSLIIFSTPTAVVKFLMLSDPLKSNLIAGLVLMLTIYFLYVITRGRGMGFGDVKFAFGMGFLLGFVSGFIALYLAFILGGVVSVWLIFSGQKDLKSKIAFGPFLVLGVFAMLFFEPEAIGIVRKFFGF